MPAKIDSTDASAAASLLAKIAARAKIIFTSDPLVFDLKYLTLGSWQ